MLKFYTSREIHDELKPEILVDDGLRNRRIDELLHILGEQILFLWIMTQKKH
jgi:hypothetical protein